MTMHTSHTHCIGLLIIFYNGVEMVGLSVARQGGSRVQMNSIHRNLYGTDFYEKYFNGYCISVS